MVSNYPSHERPVTATAREELDLAGALAIVEAVDAYLDSAANPLYQAQPLAQRWARVTKACEEAGEIWKALSRRTGENPRKGPCGTEQELLSELGDTVVAAVCGIQHETKDITATWRVVSQALRKADSRIQETP